MSWLLNKLLYLGLELEIDTYSGIIQEISNSAAQLLTSGTYGSVSLVFPLDFILLHTFSVLRIHLILMRIWIRIRTGKKDPDSNPDPGHFFKIYWFFIFFSLVFILKLDETLRNEEIFIISFFLKNSDLGFRSKKVFCCSFWFIFYPLYPDTKHWSFLSFVLFINLRFTEVRGRYFLVKLFNSYIH